MRLIKLVEGIKTGSVGALVPALALALGITSGFTIGIAGALALGGGYFICRFTRSSATGYLTPAAAIAFSGFIAGLLWIFGFVEGEKNMVLAYLVAFVLCTCGIACRISNTQESYNRDGVLGSAAGFIIICLLLGVVREIIYLSPGQSLFAAGLIFFLMEIIIKRVSRRKG